MSVAVSDGVSIAEVVSRGKDDLITRIAYGKMIQEKEPE